jgi:beta-lactam-binding protein with PASTA domain
VNELAEGLVIRTEPVAGELVRQDTVITVVVSGGPQQVAIPATIINDDVGVATQLLTNEPYALVVTTESREDPTAPVGTVLGSRPEPNTLVDRGSTVVLIVSSGPGQVTVPPLRGVPEGQARNQLEERELVPSVTYRDLAPGDANDGLVIEQSIAGGTAVDRGTTVALVVGRATAPVTTTAPPPTTTTAPPTTVPATSSP